MLSLVVLVFIHGGGFARGQACSAGYDAQQLANATSSVIVTFNYRLGAFANLVASVDGLDANLGLADQRYAWGCEGFTWGG